MNKHLELLQWCIDNESSSFDISYTFNHGTSWIHALSGDLVFNGLVEDEVDSVLLELSAAKSKNTLDSIKEKRKQALLKELAELEGIKK